MKTYFTSDFHLGSSNVIEYSHRPFENVSHMNDVLIRRVNKMLDKHDVLFHVGDFILVGHDRHDAKADYSDIKIETYLDQIKPHIVLLNGNHDADHNCHAMCNCVFVNLNRNWKNITVSHLPLTYENYKHVENENYKSCSDKIHIHLCGHVHNAWKYYYDNKANILNYNVGVDCHNYKPIRDAEIAKDLDFLFKHHDFSTHFKMTCKDEIEWKKIIKNKLACDRAVKKKTRYQKKGLTAAECLRRKEEALRKKGLLK
jgi:calcineurin-like phosphoesterase family protein